MPFIRRCCVFRSPGLNVFNNNVCGHRLYGTPKPKASNVNTIKGKTSAGTSWLRRQAKDTYVSMAQEMNYPCRSAFKLIDIDNRYKILRPGRAVVDLGCCPGGWLKVAVERCQPPGYDDLDEGEIMVAEENLQANNLDLPAEMLPKTTNIRKRKFPVRKKSVVIGVDLKPVKPIPGAYTMGNSDFLDPGVQEEIINMCKEQRGVDVVLSDMASNSCGHGDVDFDRCLNLLENIFDMLPIILKPGGSIAMKVVGNGDIKPFATKLKSHFEIFNFFKPDSVRKDSTEFYIVAKRFHVEPTIKLSRKHEAKREKKSLVYIPKQKKSKHKKVSDVVDDI